MLALEGVKLLDLSRLVPGAFCTMLLGDLGADVLKIEAPDVAGIGKEEYIPYHFALEHTFHKLKSEKWDEIRGRGL